MDKSQDRWGRYQMPMVEEAAEKECVYLQDSRSKAKGLQGISEIRETRQRDGMQGEMGSGQ